jgi:hypothetical protein
MFTNILIFFSGFTAIDIFMNKLKLDSVYYGVHAIHNALITYTCISDVVFTLTCFNAVSTYPTNMLALQLCFALHFYHIAFYWRKFRVDDWLHHLLMVGVALPIGGTLKSGSLLGYSLFFTTGLPGGLDYFMLFLSRNGLATPETQKRLNGFLQVWVRSPGCVSQAALTLVHIYSVPFSFYVFYGGVLTAVLNYWNGQYFMRQVVHDIGIQNL